MTMLPLTAALSGCVVVALVLLFPVLLLLTSRVILPPRFKMAGEFKVVCVAEGGLLPLLFVEEVLSELEDDEGRISSWRRVDM